MLFRSCNEYAGETVAERTNPAELERMTGYPVETVPPLADDATAGPRQMAIGVGDELSPAFRELLPRESS